MKVFNMCEACASEYTAPRDRRFHAEPNACVACGPAVRLTDSRGEDLPGEWLPKAVELLQAGKILAVKGIGGYHLACDATNQSAVHLLRKRKRRYEKPFAVMMRDLETVNAYCIINKDEEAALCSAARPIVLLKKRLPEGLAAELAPLNKRLGVFLPYSPLHHLLLAEMPSLVMTSANLSDEPIAYEDDDAYARLSTLADAFMCHNRRIHRRCDDSVLMCCAGGTQLLRRSRGYAPAPLELTSRLPLLAMGGEQKNTFAIVKDNQAFISQHIGELDNLSAQESFVRELADFSHMFAFFPHAVAYDMHPEYFPTRQALTMSGDILKIPVQHHHAHLASVIAEHGLEAPCIGVVFDGAGYGTDGKLWGGEFLVGGAASCRRWAHLRYIPLPGGEKAVWEPWRMALAYGAGSLGESGYAEFKQAVYGKPLSMEERILLRAIEQGVNAPESSGMGRLFDGVAALLGLRETVDYQGQAAIELEQSIAADISFDKSYAFEYQQNGESLLIDWQSLICSIAADIQQNISRGEIATVFHHAVAHMVVEVCSRIREAEGLSVVALSGGVWQNRYLLELTARELSAHGFSVFTNHRVPVNDGGLSYGQAAVAAAIIAERQL